MGNGSREESEGGRFIDEANWNLQIEAVVEEGMSSQTQRQQKIGITFWESKLGDVLL